MLSDETAEQMLQTVRVYGYMAYISVIQELTLIVILRSEFDV
jgi:hypothetical protein